MSRERGKDRVEPETVAEVPGDGLVDVVDYFDGSFRENGVVHPFEGGTFAQKVLSILAQNRFSKRQAISG